MKKIEMFTDGACSGNPGPGGWGTILRYKGVEKELSGGEHETTNNRMEMTAVISGLKALNEPCEVDLYTDSKYVCDSVTKGWVYSWKNKVKESICLDRDWSFCSSPLHESLCGPLVSSEKGFSKDYC